LLSVCLLFHPQTKAAKSNTLQHADNAQQAFSSENVPTLHLGIPALEALYRAWSSRAERPKYELFAPALRAAYEKVDEYYEKTTESPAYIMSMSMDLVLTLLPVTDDF